MPLANTESIDHKKKDAKGGGIIREITRTIRVPERTKLAYRAYFRRQPEKALELSLLTLAVLACAGLQALNRCHYAFYLLTGVLAAIYAFKPYDRINRKNSGKTASGDGRHPDGADKTGKKD